MFRTLVKSDAVSFDDHAAPVRYFEIRTLRGATRYSAEILIEVGKRIILDGDTLTMLEARVDRFWPAIVYSRMLAGGAHA